MTVRRISVSSQQCRCSNTCTGRADPLWAQRVSRLSGCGWIGGVSSPGLRMVFGRSSRAAFGVCAATVRTSL